MGIAFTLADQILTGLELMKGRRFGQGFSYLRVVFHDGLVEEKPNKPPPTLSTVESLDHDLAPETYT